MCQHRGLLPAMIRHRLGGGARCSPALDMEGGDVHKVSYGLRRRSPQLGESWFLNDDSVPLTGGYPSLRKEKVR